MPKPAKQIARLIRNHRQWLRDVSEDVFDQAVLSLERNLANADLPSLRVAASLLGDFGFYYGIRGAVGLNDGQAEAWDEINLSGSYHLHGLRLRFVLWSHLGDEPRFNLRINSVACALCFSLANQLSYWAELFADMLSQAEWNTQMVNAPNWQQRLFEPFTLQLARINESKSPESPGSHRTSGVYADILAAWHSPVLLSDALSAACDYHCENMEDDGGDWVAEFCDSPFDLIPWEVLAIQAVRRRLGHSTPIPVHPLLSRVSSFVPLSGELPTDARILAVEQLRHSLGMDIRK